MLDAAAGRSASSRLRTMAALTRMFSASVACRSQVVMNTWVGRTSSSAAAQPGGVQQVGRDRAQAVDVGRRAACQAADLPALLQQAPGQIVANDAADACNER